MRTANSLKTVAKVYALGITWTVVLLAAAVALVERMSGLYQALGVEDPVVVMVLSTSLAALSATAATAALWLALQWLGSVARVPHHERIAAEGRATSRA